MSALLLLVAGVALLNVYALALVLLRAPLFGTRLYRPMLLNIGLSVLPAAILAGALVAMVLLVSLAPSTLGLWAVLIVGAALWLLALPNSAYLITELNFSHRRKDDPTPLWFDIVLTLTLALSGVMNSLMNVLVVQVLYALVVRPNSPDPLGHADVWEIVPATLLLMSFGIYIGRYTRLNSWDVRRPSRLFTKLRDHFTGTGAVRQALGFVVAHTLFLGILYLIVVAPVVALL